MMRRMSGQSCSLLVSSAHGVNGKLTLTIHVSRNIQRSDMSLGDWLQPYSLPYTSTGGIEDMGRVVGLLSDYRLATSGSGIRTY
jgi:hypothetical protein